MNVIGFFQIIYIFIIPISLVYFGAIKYKYRFHALTLITVATAFIMFLEEWTLFDMGLRLDNFKISLFPYLIFTLVGVIAVIIFAHKSGRRPHFHPDKSFHLHFLFIPISFLQEFLFRGFLMPKLEQVFLFIPVVVIINTLIFTYLHSIYSNNKLALTIIFSGGLLFAIMYYFFPNLILITISHSIFNYVVILYGFFFKPNKKEPVLKQHFRKLKKVMTNTI